MRKAVELSELTCEQPLDQDIYDEKGRLLLRKNAIITKKFTERLKKNDITHVFILLQQNEKNTEQEDKSKENSKENKAKEKSEESEEEENKIEKFKTIPTLQEIYNELVKEQERVILRAAHRKKLSEDNNRLIRELTMIVNKNPEKALEFLFKIKANQDKYKIDIHHVNSSLTAILIASWLKLDNKTIQEIALTALVHDVGKLRMPEEILGKRGSLTESEMDVIRKHPTIGAEILMKTEWLNNRSIYGVLTHHERLDGTGYPNKLLGSKIIIHGRITAIASILNSATTNRVYAEKKNILEVLLELRNKSYGELDAKVTRVLYEKIIENICNNKRTILLSNGDKGEIKVKKTGRDRADLVIEGNENTYHIESTDRPKIISITWV